MKKQKHKECVVQQLKDKQNGQEEKAISTSTGPVTLSNFRRFKKGNQIKNKLGRGTGVALRGGGSVSKR